MASFLVTGITGQVAHPLAVSLAAAGHRVFGVARFTSRRRVRAALEAAGVTCVAISTWNLHSMSLAGLCSTA